MKINPKDFKTKKVKMVMVNFQLEELKAKKLNDFLKKNKIKKCDFFRKIIDSI